LVGAFGLLFVGITIAAMALSAGGPTPGDTVSELSRSPTQDGYQSKIHAAALLYGMGATSFIVLLTGLYARLRRDDSRSVLPSLALAAGLVVITLEMASATMIAAYPDSVDLYGSAAATSLPAALALQTTSWWFASFAGITAVAMMVPFGLSALRTGALPRWFGWVSVATAGLSVVASLLNLAPIALLVWAIAAGTALLRSRDVAQAPEPVG
jgi:hypothetical protein